jgi:NADH:ubiquinone oxidoreductase subunit 6 (subunit J)
MIGIVIYLLGVAVQYVRVNTVHKEWKEKYLEKCRREYDPAITHHFAIIGSWVAFVIMWIKMFLDRKFINKS